MRFEIAKQFLKPDREKIIVFTDTWRFQPSKRTTFGIIETYFVPPLYWYLLSCLIIWTYKRVKK